MSKLMIAYVFCGLLTFGWVAADPCPYTTGWEFDPQARQYVAASCGDKLSNFIIAPAIAVFWPLYVTYKTFQQVRK